MMTSQGEVRNFLRTKPLAMRRFQLMALEHIEQRAARIKARRDELHLTQEEVADRMQDIHRERNPEGPADKTRGQMVSDWERAANEPSSRNPETSPNDRSLSLLSIGATGPGISRSSHAAAPKSRTA